MEHWEASYRGGTIFEDSSKEDQFELADLLDNLSRKSRLAGHEVHQRFYEIGSPAGLAELNLCVESSSDMSKNAARVSEASRFTSFRILDRTARRIAILRGGHR